MTGYRVARSGILKAALAIGALTLTSACGTMRGHTPPSDKPALRATHNSTSVGSVAPAKDPVMTASIAPATNSRASTSFSLAGSYHEIAAAVTGSRRFAEEAMLRSGEHKLVAHRYSRLPQVTPTASLDQDGEAVAGVVVEQVLYDSGRYNATRASLLGEQAKAEADLALQKNTRIAAAILAYIDYHYALDAGAVADETAQLFDRFGRQASLRIQDGLGDRSEKDLFGLKLLEAQADRENFQQLAATNERTLRRLADMAMPETKPASLVGTFDYLNAPGIRKAAAEKDQAAAGVALEKSSWLPTVALQGSIDMDRHGAQLDDAEGRINVSVSKPLGWGLTRTIKSNNSQLEASQLRYDEAVRDIRDQMAVLELEIDHANAKIGRLSGVAEASRSRLDGFDDQFLTGSASLAEAVGLVETYKKSRMNLVEARYDILRSELEIAKLAGALADEH